MLSGLSKTLHRVTQGGRSDSAAGCGQARQGGWQRERHKRQRYPRALAGCLGGDSRRNRDRFAASVSPFIFSCNHFLQKNSYKRIRYLFRLSLLKLSLSLRIAPISLLSCSWKSNFIYSSRGFLIVCKCYLLISHKQ